jgi:DNA polymerase I
MPNGSGLIDREHMGRDSLMHNSTHAMPALGRRTLLIDADVLIYQYASAVETLYEWEPDRFTLASDAKEAKQRLDLAVAELKEDLEADDFVMCLSDVENFRKVILPTYKASRKKTRKPLCFIELKEYVQDTYRSRLLPGLEADDVLGILMTGRRIRGEKVIVTVDKDLDTIPGLHFNPWKDDQDVVDITPEEADYNHLFQTLTGDATDGYTGIPGVGPKRAAQILDGAPSWQSVVAAYEKAGLCEEEALVQARVARILRKSEWNERDKSVRLWTP